jgi:hypothetical protein
MDKILSVECPLKKECLDRKGEGCSRCEYYHRCIWFRIYEKLICTDVVVRNLWEGKSPPSTSL